MEFHPDTVMPGIAGEYIRLSEAGRWDEAQYLVDYLPYANLFGVMKAPSNVERASASIAGFISYDETAV